MAGVLYARVGGSWIPIGGGGMGGGGVEEVWVGPEQPGDTYELWVDTDEAVALPEDTRWNTAWGIVHHIPHRNVTDPIPLATGGAYITEIAPFTPMIGRKYRLVASLRATQTTAGVGSFFLSWTEGYNVGTGVPGLATQWTLGSPVASDVYGGGMYQWFIHGDGLLHNYALLANITGSTNRISIFQSASHFYIEDVGPVTGSVPVANPTPAWMPMMLANGWVAGTPVPQYRKVGDMVQLRGGISHPTAMTVPSVSQFSTLPAGYRPPASINVIINGVGSDNWGCPNTGHVQPDGAVLVHRTAEGATRPNVGTGFNVSFSVTP